MLGANLIGFHTFGYARHFSDALLGNLGIEPELDRVDVEGGKVSIGVFPMGIDVQSFERLANSAELPDRVSELRRAQGVEQLLLGVDRLDYTKGIPRKLLAMERLLERSPHYRGKVRLLQVAVPSRENVAEYKSLARRRRRTRRAHQRRQRFAARRCPIHYLYKSLTQEELVASYRAADIMVVTPLRDGMNLVAKEYVASRTDGDGVLVLSELAGAASELGEALTVNPYDVESLAVGFDRALSMPESERRERMSALRDKVRARPVELWAQSFVSALEAGERGAEPRDLRRDPHELEALAQGLATHSQVLLALDYDGTLVPIVRNPDLARPDAALRELLAMLARMPGVEVCVVSGRAQSSLASWLGELPIDLVAEHGVWSKRADAERVEVPRRPEHARLAAPMPGRSCKPTSSELPGHSWKKRPQVSPGTTGSSILISEWPWPVSCASTSCAISRKRQSRSWPGAKCSRCVPKASTKAPPSVTCSVCFGPSR